MGRDHDHPRPRRPRRIEPLPAHDPAA
jgi:hypothetical protein